MLEVTDLTCGYGGRPVIKELSFSVNEGEKLCVLGANGSGKTTLLRGIAGLIRSTGQALINGRDILKLKPVERARQIALMSQFEAPALGYTVYEAAAMGRYAHGGKTAFWEATSYDKQIIESSLKNAGVWNIKDRRMTELSGGQMQRVFLARAFAQQPCVLLLDEPMNHLDLKARRALTNILDEWVREKPRAIIGVFHDLSPALTFSDTALLLLNGQMLAKSRVDDLDFDLLNKLYDMDVRSYMRGLAKIWL